jgi:hypothetical protein
MPEDERKEYMAGSEYGNHALRNGRESTRRYNKRRLR